MEEVCHRGWAVRFPKKLKPGPVVHTLFLLPADPALCLPDATMLLTMTVTD